MERFRVRHAGHVKSVTLDTTVSEYLALHLGTEPGGPAARKAIRAWLQVELDRLSDPDHTRPSQWLLGRAVDAVARSELIEARDNWLLKELVTRAPAVPAGASR